MVLLLRDILADFAAYGTGAGEDGVIVRGSMYGFREPMFNVDDPTAMAREQRRLEALAALRRAAAPSVRKVARPRPPCKVCGGETPANNLGPVAEYCGQKCRSRANYLAKIATGCARARCTLPHEPGRPLCRPHLDECAAKERLRREARKAA